MEVQIKESQYSLQSKLIKLVDEHCSGLKVLRGEELRFYKSSIWREQSDKIAIKHSVVSLVAPLFADGKMKDIEIIVKDERYFGGIQKVAEEWARISQCKVTIIKKF